MEPFVFWARYRTDDEEWALKPGELVVVRQHVFSDGIKGLVADRLAIEEACIRVELASDELRIICNALNEVCNGVGLGEEFETRMGSTIDTSRKLLARLSAFRNSRIRLTGGNRQVRLVHHSPGTASNNIRG